MFNGPKSKWKKTINIQSWTSKLKSQIWQHQGCRQETPQGKKMTKQLTEKRDDTPLHAAARAGKLAVMKDTILETDEIELH